MGIPSDYNDDTKRRNTHPLLLPRSEAGRVISKKDLEVLKRAIGSDNIQEDKRIVNSKLILQPVNRNPAIGAYCARFFV